MRCFNSNLSFQFNLYVIYAARDINFNFWMLTKFVLISLIKSGVCKTLNPNISGYVNNITLKLEHHNKTCKGIYAINSNQKLVR